MASSKFKVAILIVSDTAANDPSTDACGDVLAEVFTSDGAGQWDVAETKIVPDNVLDIQRAVTQWTDREIVNLVLTSGGTGFAIKDNTPEAIESLVHKHAPGLVHGMLAASLSVTPFALMSRPVAGVRNKSLILTLPGSPKGAKENLQAVLKLLPHACSQAAGANSRALHAGGIKKLEKEAGVESGSKSALGSNAQHHHHHHHHDHGHGHNHGKHGGHAIPIPHTDPESRPKSNDPSQGATSRNRTSPWPMLSVDEASKLIKEFTPTEKTVRAPVNSSLIGAVLAEDVKAAEAVPAFRASIVDGYAVIATGGQPNTKGVFPVASISHAAPGEIPELKVGQITRITTGAPLPPGATSVVMVEDTLLKSTTDDGKEEKEVEILTDAIKPGENVREVGSDIQAGETILSKGDEISAVGGELGLLASVGVSEVTIYQRPVVGVLSTGDEIIQHDRPGNLRLGEVRDCNRPTIMAAASGWGFEVVDLGIARDKPGALEETLRDALRKVDVIITTGGVSMGELDLLKPTIERSLGGKIHFGRVAMKPGKPTTFATVPFKDNNGERQNKVIFSLPGNPASAVVTFHLFVLPSLHHSSGISPAGLPAVTVGLDHDVRLDPNRAEYHRAIVTAKADGLLHASSTGNQRSSRVGSLKSANALLCLPAGNAGPPSFSKGHTIKALLMGQISSS